MPLTAAERAVNVKIENEGLHRRRDDVLSIMRDSHAEKLLRVAPDLDRALNFPDAIRWELKEQGELTDAEIESELVEQQVYYQWKVDRLTEVVSLIDSEVEFRGAGKVSRSPVQ